MRNRDAIADLDDTISLIYEAAFDPALWPAVLRRITERGRAICTFLPVPELNTARLASETARWRLKQVLAKTDTHRQAELVCLLLSSAVLGRGIDTRLRLGPP